MAATSSNDVLWEVALVCARAGNKYSEKLIF